jgi:transcriptional regulator with PAS, ATPase and Fis domain
LEICDTTATLGIEAGTETGGAPTLTGQRAKTGLAGDPTLTPAHPHAGQTLENFGNGQGASAAAVSVLDNWIAADPKSLELLERAKRLAESAATVLVRGESGVGKNLLASILHYLGRHADEPLVKIDCAAMPSPLIEHELLGYERGAFPGAAQAKHGRLEMAGRGTVVLEEVAALSMPVQAKLLHVIEEKRFQRLGGSRTIETGARIIALTSIDLERAVSRHSFREDLYYRLNVTSVAIPALRERPRDIGPLTCYLLQRLADIHRKPLLSLSQEALAALERYSFPGNVRELRNIIEQAVIRGTAPELMLEDLPEHIRRCAGSTNGTRKSLEQLEREYIAEILDFTRGKKTKAAAILGISRKTLLEKRKRYGLG